MDYSTRLGAVLRAFSNLFGAIATLFLLFLMFGITLDAIVRALYGHSIPGLFEMSELSLVVIVFLGLGWTQMEDAHIRVTLLHRKVPPRVAQWMDALAWLAAAVVLALLAYPATGEALESIQIREFRWGYVEVPIWWTKAIVAAGLWFGALQMLAQAGCALCRAAPVAAAAPALAPH
ncbi:MAG: TRAP transporter small permease subunit [Achromobacter pulmonis]|uniref:TRAP transporter small permease protein n=1 Tax=Achromobacter pulmonis TaxID=1389932 RepID=A0A6S7CK08_9BURK|nr:TRAP transporter small permease [Achromobacter pulmonis]MCF7769539.1 TRAP transporter small permease [Achromobacter pulmonis]MPT30034.1 TRAP transporter small permease [Achromobacter sp.]CAB3636036.1 hypothetical protein LMG26696_01650 [Achromobacter pulmonis]CAB3849603.1 hypothetical protein LMG26788_01687 [Achromobacter pulmonis]